MEIREMQMENIEARKLEIAELIKAEDADLDALTAEVDELNARAAEIKEAAEKRSAIIEAVSAGEGTVIEERKEEIKMDVKELRNSAEYMNAYANYIKTGDDTECRSLLTENVSGTIAIPDVVMDTVKTAWDKNDIMSLVSKVELKGNVKINFEISGTDAVIHTEGTGAVAEEELVEGIVTIIPAYIKKWIAISDEVMSMRGEKFLQYIYAELTHKIVKKAADELVRLIAALPQVATSTSPSAAKISMAPAMGTVASAVANLSDEAENPVIIMNKLTYANFKAVQYANGYGVDPFEGLAVKFNASLPAFDTAEAGAVYMIVGDLGQGAIANFPNGDEIEFKFDELSRKKEDLVEVLGKEYVGLGVVACKAFTLVAKAEG